MIKIKLINKISQITNSANLDRFEPSELLPIPKKITIKDNKWFQYSKAIQIEAEGKFISQDLMPKRGNLPSIREPDWDVRAFLSRIESWVLENINYPEPLELKFSIGSVKENEALTFNPLDTFVPENTRSEAYYLKITPKEIIIYSWTRHGTYYSLLTLSQLARIHEKKVFFPESEILDYPDFEIRGLVDDISRGQRPTMENFKKFIKYMSSLKLNVHTLYIEDLFQFKKYPQIGKNRAPLNRALIKELEDFALEHFMEIQVGFECFGHQDNLLTLPEFQKYGEFPGAQCFDVSNSEAKEFVDDLLSEICPAVSSPAFHLICDESFDFNLGKSRAHVKKIGEAKALADWYLFLVQTAKKYGKTFVTIAHDIIYKYPKTLEAVKEEIPLICYWKYNNKKKHPIISKLKAKGFTISGLPAVFDWSRHYPYYDYALANMANMARDGLQRGLIGQVTTKFGDFFNENFRKNIYFGLAIEAQAAWNINDLDISKIQKGFNWLFFGTRDPRIINCMDLLNKQNQILPSFPNGMFNRYWMDPYCRAIKSKEYKYAKRFIEESLAILKIITQTEQEQIIRKNRDNLDYIKFAARMALHYGVKILASEAAFKEKFDLVTNLSLKLKELAALHLIPAVQSTDEKIKSFIDLTPLFEWLSADIQSQLEVYRELWLRLAEPEGLEYPKRRFEVLNWHYEQSLAALKQNEKPKAHQLKSHWIWRSGRRISSSWGNEKWYYFYKPFFVKNRIKKAIVQGIAGNHLILYINQEKIGEVLSRFSLSQLPMANSVQWFEITSVLKENRTNMACVEAINWARGIGGINIMIHLEYENGEIEDIVTDPTWRYAKEQPEQWPLGANYKELSPPKWKNARSFGKPPLGWNGPISAPVWNKNWKSEISFSFGLRSYIETAIKSFIGDILYKILFPIIPLGIKLLGADLIGFRKSN